LVLACTAATLTRVAPSKAQGTQPINGKGLSLLVEQGFVLPSQLLAGAEREGITTIAPSDQSNRIVFTESVKLPDQFKTGAPFDATFTISGNARFDSAQGMIAVTGANNGVITTPPIVAGPSFGESFINVVADGETAIENLRLVTLEPGGIDNLTKIIGTDDPGLIVLGDHYAVLDEGKMRETTQTVTGWVESPSTSKRGAKTKTDSPSQDAPRTEEQISPLGLCVRSPLGPGRVNWHWSSSNPWATGGWAYKPETLRVVYRADDRVNDSIDGLYRRSWGCGTAYKVPDSCTVDVYQNNTWSYCCNAAAWAAGHRVGFVNSSALANPAPPCPW
jgi:hypothetical protein